MRRVLLLLVLVMGTIISYGQIIVDHQAVTEFDSIPPEYITEVKKMMVAFPGESHSAAMRWGMELLEASDATYACNVSTAEAYTDQYVRVEDYGWIGEYEWFVWYAFDEEDRPYPVDVAMKNLMWSYHDSGYPITAMGFGWCYDMVIGEGNETAGTDPVHNVHWYGASAGGPDGNKGWGLDEDDYALTGNRVSLQTYFDAMEDYIAYSNTYELGTKVVFTTGTVDFEGEWWGEGGYQGHIKHETIRNYVKADPSKILFDYADILCHDDDGTMNTQTWNGHTYPSITSTNELPRNYGHISDAGALKLAKAQWWMLARIAGWEGVSYEGNSAPTVPGGVTITSVSETSVSLSWTASTDDVAVSGYRIYRDGVLLGNTTGLSYTDNSITSCGSFSYRISAFDGEDMESDLSSAVQVNTCSVTDDSPPTVPSMLDTTSVAETMVSLSWTASTDDTGVSGYRIYRSGSQIGSTSGLSFTDNTLSSCGAYSYTVSAYDAAGNESAQSEAIQVNTCPATDDSPPTVPSMLDTTSVAETMVSLSWTASIDDTGVSGYRIYRSGSQIGSTSGLSFTDNTLSSCGAYSYTVSAYDAAGNESAQSDAIQVNTCLPDDPGTWTDNSLTGQLSIYPNPSGDHFMIDMGQVPGNYTLEVLSSSGYTLIRKELQLNKSPLPVNMEEYPAGIYYIRVYNGEQSFRGKLVLTR